MACAPCQKKAEERRKQLMEQIYGKDSVDIPSTSDNQISDKGVDTDVNSVYQEFKAKILNSQSLIQNNS